jgi:hypothetical protein
VGLHPAVASSATCSGYELRTSETVQGQAEMSSYRDHNVIWDPRKVSANRRSWQLGGRIPTNM